MEKIDNVYEIAEILLGKIEPLGETNIDKTRLGNLKQTIEVVDKLVNDIDLVARHRNRSEASMNEAGKVAHEFLTALKNALSDY